MREDGAMRTPAGLTTDEIAPVWLLDDPADVASAQAISIAERIGVPHLRIPLNWTWRARATGLTRRGTLRGLATAGWPFSAPRGPALAISAGSRSEAVALWLRQEFGTRVVHCGRPRLRSNLFDLVVTSKEARPRQADNVLPVLGPPHRLSPLVLAQARVSWAGRLSHLPRPLVALLVGGGQGGEMRPAAAHALARQVARMAASAGGSVLASTSRRTGDEATDAIADGLAPCMNLLYRWGEPGENPYAATIALADATVVTGNSSSMVCEACGGEAPVFIASLGATPRQRRLHELLFAASQARPMQHSLQPWPRTPLDEAGRVAAEIRARMSVGPQGID